MTATGPIRGDHEHIAVLELHQPDDTVCARSIELATIDYESGSVSAGPIEAAGPTGPLIATVTLYACTVDISCADLTTDKLDAAVVGVQLFESSSCHVELSAKPNEVVNLHADAPSEGDTCAFTSANESD